MAELAGADADPGGAFTGEAYSWLAWFAVSDFFDVGTLLPELITGVGLALLLGNGLAWWRHRRGETPAGVEGAGYRSGRVLFLLVVGLIITTWGLVTLLN